VDLMILRQFLMIWVLVLILKPTREKPPNLPSKIVYDTVVAEFSYNPEFRDRVSNIESILATLQNKSPDANIVVLYDEINADMLEQFQKRYKIDSALSFPVDELKIKQAL
jgi:predicted dinucleotide-binding enzyme